MKTLIIVTVRREFSRTRILTESLRKLRFEQRKHQTYTESFQNNGLHLNFKRI